MELKHALADSAGPDFFRKRLAYQSAVRLAEAAVTLDHRSLYNRLFDIRVAGGSNPLTAFDGGAAARAADTYTVLLSSEVKAVQKRRNVPSPAFAASTAYQNTIDQGLIGASKAAMAELAKAGWLPSPLPPIAWLAPPVSQRTTHDLRPVLIGLRRMHESLCDALRLVRQVSSFIDAAREVTNTYREGSAVRLLIPLLASEPVASQGLILKCKLMSDVAFQNGINILVEHGICIELTKRQSHRGWAAAGKGLLPSFDGFEVEWFQGDCAKERQSPAPKPARPNQRDDLAELDKAVADLDRLLQP